MLCISRKESEGFEITTPSGDRIHIMVTNIRGNVVQVGVTAARDYRVLRDELVGQQPAVKRPVPAPHFGGGTVGGMYAMG